MKNKTLIYSWWLWLLSILYYTNIIQYSPRISMYFAFYITLYLVFVRFRKEYVWSKRIFIIATEFFFLQLTYYKNPDRYIFNTKDLIFNFIMLIIYCIYLWYNNTNVFKLYLETIPKSHEGEGLFDHIKKFL